MSVSLSITVRRAAAALAASVLALSLAACGSAEPAASDAATSGAAAQASGVTFTDDLGNEVTVDNPQRVVVGTGAAAGLRPVPVTLGLSRSVLPHRWQ